MKRRFARIGQPWGTVFPSLYWEGPIEARIPCAAGAPTAPPFPSLYWEGPIEADMTKRGLLPILRFPSLYWEGPIEAAMCSRWSRRRRAYFLPYTGRAPLKPPRLAFCLDFVLGFPSLYWEGPIEASGRIGRYFASARFPSLYWEGPIEASDMPIRHHLGLDISFPILGGPH